MIITNQAGFDFSTNFFRAKQPKKLTKEDVEITRNSELFFANVFRFLQKIAKNNRLLFTPFLLLSFLKS